MARSNSKMLHTTVMMAICKQLVFEKYVCSQSVGINSMFSSRILLQRVYPSIKPSSRQTCAFCMSGGPLSVKCLLAVPLYEHI